MKTHAERFRHLLQEWGLTQEELGNLCGLKRGTIGTIVNGKTLPDVQALAQLKKAKPELSWDWLLLGDGPMTHGGRTLTPIVLKDDSPAVHQPVNAINSGPATVAEAENVLLREQVADLKADKAFLLSELGKFGGSSDAAGILRPTQPRTPAGFMTDARRAEIAEQFNDYVEMQLEQVEVGR